MALIKCPECGKEISEFAHMCIGCGCPMEKITQLLKKKTVDDIVDDGSLVASDFVGKLTPSEKKAIHLFDVYMKGHYPDFISKDYELYYGYKRKQDPFLAFWFTKINGKLAFKYRPALKKESKEKVYTDGKITEVGLLTVFVKSLIESYEGNNEPTKEKEDNRNFFETLSEYEKNVITSFGKQLIKEYHSFKISFEKYIVGYKYNNEDPLFWFSKPDGVLIFVRPNDAQGKSNPKIYYQVLSGGVNSLMNIVREIMDKKGITNTKPFRLLQIGNLISFAITGRKINPCQHSLLAENIGEFVLSEVCYNAIEDGKFKSIEEFDKYKYKYHSYRFFDMSISLKFTNANIAMECFEYYVASNLMSVIQKYERIHNVIIVDDRVAFAVSCKKMVHEGIIEYDKITGLKSTFNLVPIEALDDELKKYIVNSD